MTRPIEAHLTSAELQRWLEGQLLEPERRALALHLAGCEECAGKVSAGEQERELSERSSSAGCPGEREWLKVVAGLVPEADAEPLLLHAAECDACARRLRQATEELHGDLTQEEQALISPLEAKTDSQKRALAAQLAQVSRHGSFGGFWLSAAAVVALLAALGVWMVLRQRSLPSRLLAQAYSQQRTIEYRFPGASYAAYQVRRGTAGSTRPTPLVEAELAANKALAGRPDDPSWLEVRGRVQLLEWDFPAAIENLQHALQLRPGDPFLEADLAMAYFERGEAEDRPSSYSAALEQLDRAVLSRPSDPVLRFNRAVTYERLALVDSASREWQEFLRLDSSSPWASEARTRLEALQSKKKTTTGPEPTRN
jgi:tetratricopeptide (TPR) repeat protein